MPVCDTTIRSIPHRDEVISVSLYVRDDTRIGEWERMKANLDRQYPDWKQYKGLGIHSEDIHITFTVHVDALSEMILDGLEM